MKLGKLEKVSLRNFWKNEARDFTPWLAEEDNIAILGESLNIELEVLNQEEPVGPFRADILCKDIMSDHYVLIENQISKTDHTHLGQIITYAAGLDAVTIIWISESFTEEHRAAIDWLNRITDESINFFGVEIELYKIENSPLAPKFNIIAKPNNWAKVVKQTAARSENSEIRLKQHEYWEEFKKYIKNNKLSLESDIIKRNWMYFPLKSTKYKMFASIHLIHNFLRIEIIFYREPGKLLFSKLKKKYEEDSRIKFDKNIVWDDETIKSASWVYFKKPAEFLNKEDRKNQFKWLAEHLEKFRDYIVPKIKEMEKTK